MNDESMKSLERELSRFRPAGLPEGLKRRLANAPENERLTFADRVLVTFSSLGALAACVIVAVGVAQATTTMPRALSPQEIAAQQRMVIEYQRILAAR